MFRLIPFYICFLISALFLIVFEQIFTGKLLPNFYNKNVDFDSELANNHWKFLTKEPRTVGSQHYNDTVNYILDHLEKYQKDAKQIFEISTENYRNFPYQSVGINAVRGYFTNIIVNFKFNPNPNETLYIAAHFDGHDVGQTAYDDAISIAVMIELVHSVSQLERALNYSIIFFFDGAEEFGMEASLAFLKDHNPTGYLLNLESLGAGLPFWMPTKTKNQSSIIKTWGKVFGAVAATFHNDIIGTGIVKSSSDLRTFEKYGVNGAELVFTGNPAHYHTVFDRMQSPNHVKYEGHLLVDFINKFQIDTVEKNQLLLGISPFIISLDLETVQKIIISCILIAILCVALKAEIKDFLKSIGFTILSIIIVFFVAGAIGHDIYKRNSLSYLDNLLLASIIIPFFFYNILSLSRMFIDVKPNSILLTRLVLDMILCLLLFKTDTSLIACIWIISSIIQITISNAPKIIRAILEIVLLIPTYFSYMLLFRTLGLYTSILPGVIGDLLCMALGYLFALKLFLSFSAISMSDETEEAEQPVQYKDKNRKPSDYFKFVPVTFSMAIYLYFLFKQEPYSDLYPIKGSFAYYLFDNMTSILSFFPEGGKRMIPFLEKTLPSKYSTVPSFRRAQITQAGSIFIKKQDTLPLFITEWPHIQIEKTPDHSLHVQLLDNDQNVESLYVVAQCEKPECVYECKQCASKKFEYLQGNKFEFRNKVANPEQQIDLVIEKGTPIEVIMCFSEKTKQQIQFEKEFPSYVVSFSKNRLISGTCLVNQTII